MDTLNILWSTRACPINSKMITQLVQHLDPESLLDAAIAACATTAFWE